MRSIHICLSVDIDRHDDKHLAREYLPMFHQQHGFTTVREIRAYCAEARAKGFDAFPPCDNHDERGHCKGHEDDRQEGQCRPPFGYCGLETGHEGSHDAWSGPWAEGSASHG